MVNSKTFRRSFLSLAMLVLFAFSITPKKVLHDVFGCHKELTKNLANDGKEHFNVKNFHCACQQPELQAPFLSEPCFAGLKIPAVFYPQPADLYTSALYDNSVHFFPLRGPPAIM